MHSDIVLDKKLKIATSCNHNTMSKVKRMVNSCTM